MPRAPERRMRRMGENCLFWNTRQRTVTAAMMKKIRRARRSKVKASPTDVKPKTCVTNIVKAVAKMSPTMVGRMPESTLLTPAYFKRFLMSAAMMRMMTIAKAIQNF